MLTYILISIIAILVIILVIQHKKVSHVVEVNTAAEQRNKELNNEYQQLSQQKQEEERKLQSVREQITIQDNFLQSITSTAENAKKNAEAQAAALQKARTAAENELKAIKETQISALQEDFEKRRIQQEKDFEVKAQERNSKLEEEFALKFQKLSDELNSRSIVLLKQVEEKQKQLADLEAKQQAYIQAKKREEEIEAQRDYFRLVLSDLDLNDIQLLRDIQLQFSHKEAIDKLIWETYYKSPYDVLMSHVFENNSKVCGIYKITNLDNGQAYIGQSVDIRERWRQHIKASLSFTPPANKLYQQMKKFGPQNFTFEVLEIVERDKLNERESYWIDFYKTKDYGMNSQKGNG